MKYLYFCCLVLGSLIAGQVSAGDCQVKQQGTLRVDMFGEQPTTLMRVNGLSTRFIVDTGAFFSTISDAKASELGLKLEPLPSDFRISGVGGSATVHQTHVQRFGILDTTIFNVGFLVGGSDEGLGLLGANVLDMSNLEIDLAQGKMTLFEVNGCANEPLAYWAKDGIYNIASIEPAHEYDRRTFIQVNIHGKTLRALLDSGASATVLTRDAAKKAGIDLNVANIKAPTSLSTGVGAKAIRSSIVNVDSFSVGTETIQHSQMMMIDGKLGDNIDMLLGVDFLLAHRIFISNSTNKAYFSYNGGRMFTYAAAPSDNSNAGVDSNSNDKSEKLKTAGDYFLRAQAHSSRGELDAALSDFNEAIRIVPYRATYYFDRAKLYGVKNQPDAQLSDLNKAIELDPKYSSALMARAEFRFVRKDYAGARLDLTAIGEGVAPGSTLQRDMATFYLRLDQPETALPMLDSWISLHGNDVKLGETLGERCWARALSNKMLDDALKDCKKAIELVGEKPLSLNGLGLVELRLGHYSQSVRHFERQVTLEPQSAWARHCLGLAQLRLADKDAGNASLSTARAIDPQVGARAVRFGITIGGT